MSKMRLDGKPPLAKSPIRLRSRAVLRSDSAVSRSLQTPPGSLTKSKKVVTKWDAESWELRSLARTAVEEEVVKGADSTVPGFGAATPGSMFERGRFYDLYSARRNERLRRKRGETVDEKKSWFGLGVAAESTKKKDSKKLGSLRKSVCSAYSSVMERSETPAPRYLLRSSVKDSKKPPIGSAFGSALNSEKRASVARRAKKF